MRRRAAFFRNNTSQNTDPDLLFSLKQYSGYEGPCMTVRRSTDNVLEDIGFVSGELDTVSLLDFIGAANGLVVKWYEQTGTGLSFEQPTAANQPRIVSGGAVTQVGGNPALSFDTHAKWLYITDAGGYNADLHVYSGSRTPTMFAREQSGTFFYGAAESGSGSTVLDSNGAGSPDYFINGNPSAASTRGDFYNETLDGSLKLLSVNNINIASYVRTGYNTSWGYAQYLLERRFYRTALTPEERALAETAINNLYQIY